MSGNYYRSFIKDNTIVIIGHILVYMKGIILMPIIIKSVGVTIYGGFVLLTAILGIAFGLSSLGVGFKARRFMPSSKDMTERADLFYPQFYFNILIILFLSLLFVLLEKPLNTHFFKNEISFSIWIMPLYLVLYLLYAQGCDYCRYTSRINYMALATVCFPYLHIVFILFYLYVCGPISINMLVISTALSAVLIALPCFSLIFREIGFQLSFYKISSLMSDIKLGFPLILVFIVDLILAGGDRYFIAFYLSIKNVGYYVPGYVLGSLIVFIPKAMGTALPQLLSRAVDSGEEAKAHMMLDYSIKIYLLLAIPFIFGCLAIGESILILLANQEVAEKAFWVTPIVAIGTLFYGLNLILSNVMFVRLKTNAMFKMNIIAALFSLLANFVLFYFFRNIMVAAITTFLSFFIAFVYAYKIVIKEWPVNFQPYIIAKALFASIIMYVVILFLKLNLAHHNSLGQILLAILVGIPVYTVILFVFKTFSEKEIGYIKGVFS